MKTQQSVAHIGRILVSLSILLSFTGCRNTERYYEESGTVFHTLYSIKYQSSQLFTEEIDAELQAINLSLNPFNPNSIIAKINNNEEVEVDDHFRTVFTKAMEISENSHGVFDITSGPLINMWGFGTTKADSVTPAMVDSVKQFVGYRKVSLQGNSVIKEDPRIRLNCSAIAKGYASDVVAALLERKGVKNYMVEIGGEVAMKGINEKGQPWRVGIRKPEDIIPGKASTVEEVVQPARKCGVATSGDYLNYYIKNGKKYAHTISPVTGYPAEQNILSCTVVADDCMTADGYATAMMASGYDRAVQMADSLKQFEYFLIYSDDNGKDRIKYSAGMVSYLPNRKNLSILENAGAEGNNKNSIR